MLIIKDNQNNVEALTDFKDCEIAEEVNGDFSIFFTAFLTERNQHSFPLIQEESLVEIDGHEFRIKILDEVRNYKSVLAQHIFFDLKTHQVYNYFGGTKTIDEVFQFVLVGTGWTFENVDVTNTEIITNFGEDNALSLIRQVCEIFKCEVKIEPNKHIKICRMIGDNTDNQFRYKHNIKKLKKSVDTSNLTTVIRGYGANGLEVEYRSPVESIYGEKHAESIKDEDISTTETMIERLKKEITDFPEVSIEVETIVLGFDVELGDRVWLIYEPTNIDFQTRVISRKYYPFSKKNPTVTFSNKKQAFTDLLTQAKVDMKENQKETRSKFDQTNEQITLAVERIGEAETQLSLQSDQIELRVTKDGVIGAINLTSEEAKIQASRISLVGAVTVLSDITGELGTITAGNIYGVNIYGGTITSDTTITVGTDMTIGGQLNLGTSIAINDFKVNFGNVADFTVWMGNSDEYHIDYNAFKHHFYGTVDFSGASVDGLNVNIVFG